MNRVPKDDDQRLPASACDEEDRQRYRLNETASDSKSGGAALGSSREVGIVNAFTVDVEDYFHVSAFSGVIDREDWDTIDGRVEGNTHQILDLLAEHSVTGTFFVLGWVAQRHPDIVREIVAQGHEVGCHGFSHRLVYEQTPTEFRQETERAKALLEDQAQVPILGYRAASWSITPRSLWALDIIAELGFEYDSSIFSVRHDIYGLPGAPRFLHKHMTASGLEVMELPPSTVEVFKMRLPIGGGGYFRLYPYLVSRTGLRHINESERQPFVFYTHPWEIDVDQPKIRSGARSRFRHYTNIDKCAGRIRKMLSEFRFDSAVNVIERYGQESRSDASVIQAAYASGRSI